MSTIVKSTPEAILAIQQIKLILGGGLMEQITALQGQGTTLSDRNNWAGPKADEFENRWRTTYGHLVAVQHDLEELNNQVSAIQVSIQSAGGAN